MPRDMSIYIWGCTKLRKKSSRVRSFGRINTYRRGVCVARFDQSGNARASKCETGNRYRFSRFSYM